MGSGASKEVASAAIGGGLSAEERWNLLERTQQEYLEYLSQTGGFVLTAAQRIHVANLTLSVLDCPDCAKLPKDACLLPSTNTYDAILECLSPHDDDKALVHMVHSLVHHQGRIATDPTWYETTMEKLKTSSNLLDEKRLEAEGLTSDTQKQYLYYGLFAELTMVISSVQCFHMLNIMEGNAPGAFKMIPASANATPPSYFDWSKVLKSATHDTKLSTMPFIAKASLDTTSPALKKFIPNDKELQWLLGDGTNPMAPFLCITWSPHDFAWIKKIDSALYLDEEDFFAPHKPLNPASRCASHFSRRDVEVVATAASTKKTPAAAAVSPREALLRKFAMAATARPLDRTLIAKVRQEVLQELGPEVLVEAAGVVGAYECVTKVVDATGKKLDPKLNFFVVMLATCNRLYSYALSWLPKH